MTTTPQIQDSSYAISHLACLDHVSPHVPLSSALEQIFCITGHAVSLRPLGLLRRPLVLQFLQIDLGLRILVVGLVIVGVGVKFLILVASASYRRRWWDRSVVCFWGKGWVKRTEAEEVGHCLRKDITCDLGTDLRQPY